VSRNIIKPCNVFEKYDDGCSSCFVPPMSMAATEKTFSAFVLGETLPKPTEVRLVQVKYSAEM